jgi:hypothetical protein
MTKKEICNVAVKPNIWCGTLITDYKIKELEKLKTEISDGDEVERLHELNSALVDLKMKIRTYENITSVPYFLQEIIPGDLLVEFLRTNNIEIIRRELSHYQLYEYQQSIFFQRHGQEGNAFQN